MPNKKFLKNVIETMSKSYEEDHEREMDAFGEYIVQMIIGITRMRTYRNGLDSPENKAIERIRNDILNFFKDVKEKDVNEIMDENELFREYFKLPRKGDRTWPDGVLKDDN